MRGHRNVTQLTLAWTDSVVLLHQETYPQFQLSSFNSAGAPGHAEAFLEVLHSQSLCFPQALHKFSWFWDRAAFGNSH